MKLLIIFGPQAVGKMTVGHELEKITGLKLFHNHMAIEVVKPIFDYGTEEGRRLVKVIRQEILSAVAKSNMEGVIFTMVWEFDENHDWDYVKELSDMFAENGGQTYLVELEADIDTRLERNKTAHRLNHKVSKRDTEWSEGELMREHEESRVNSKEGEIQHENYMRINNSEISAKEVAEKIKSNFKL